MTTTNSVSVIADLKTNIPEALPARAKATPGMFAETLDKAKVKTELKRPEPEAKRQPQSEGGKVLPASRKAEAPAEPAKKPTQKPTQEAASKPAEKKVAKQEDAREPTKPRAVSDKMSAAKAVVPSVDNESQILVELAESSHEMKLDPDQLKILSKEIVQEIDVANIQVKAKAESELSEDADSPSALKPELEIKLDNVLPESDQAFALEPEAEQELTVIDLSKSETPQLELTEKWVAMRPDMVQATVTNSVMAEEDAVEIELSGLEEAPDFGVEETHILKPQKVAIIKQDGEVPVLTKQAETQMLDKMVRAVAADGNVQQMLKPEATNKPTTQTVTQVTNVASLGMISETTTDQKLPSLKVNTPVQSPQFSKAMSEQIQVMLTKNLQQARIALNPANLGPIDVAVKTRDEEVTVAFVVTNPVAKEAIESAVSTLKDMLENAGFSSLDVSVSDQSDSELASGDQSGGSDNNPGSTDATETDTEQQHRVSTHDGLVDHYV